MFDHKIFFDAVRESLFNGRLTQPQVDGMDAILDRWEVGTKIAPLFFDDERHLAYMLATTLHETAREMQPIEEYGKGHGKSYGKIDPETGQAYYGRGYVQLTWRDNYKRATSELELKGDDNLEWHAARALDESIAADIMFAGMREGWFRTHNDGRPETLHRYFNGTKNDPFGAREIINGDKTKVPKWSNGVNIGTLISGYHGHFLAALLEAQIPEEVDLPPEIPSYPVQEIVTVEITTTANTKVFVKINGKVFEGE